MGRAMISAGLSESRSESEGELERMHRQMLSSVSHDLRTPLASIIGSLEIFERVRERLTAEKQTALVDVALHEAYRLDNFIINILDMAKLESGSVKPNWEESEMGIIIRRCFVHMANRLSATEVTLKDDAPVEIRTDAILLERVLTLITDNAVKYGGSPSQIIVEYGRESANMGYIDVHDNGRGVPQAQMDTIFSKYTRLAKEDQQNAGTGLGLAIATAIMKLLGGSITVLNRTDDGAHFTIHHPVLPHTVYGTDDETKKSVRHGELLATT